MAKKTAGLEGVPLPPIPKWMLPKDDPEYEPAAELKPDDIRARLQLGASRALDILDWHAMNLAESKASEDACRELLDRAGYVAPAKAKGDVLMSAGGGGSALPPIEDDIRGLSEEFSKLPARAPGVEDEGE